MNPTLFIQFNSRTWKPTMVIINGETDLESAELKKFADIVLVALAVSEEFEDCAVAIEEEDPNIVIYHGKSTVCIP